MHAEIDRMIHVLTNYGEAVKVSVVVGWLEQIKASLPEGGLTWVSVEDRLPQPDHWSYCWVARGRLGSFVAEFWQDDNEFWPPNGKGEYWAEKYHDVTHWAPFEFPPTPQVEKP